MGAQMEQAEVAAIQAGAKAAGQTHYCRSAPERIARLCNPISTRIERRLV
jgi:hypothetical protein